MSKLSVIVISSFQGLVYYMAVSGLLGEKNDVARLKLLLNDRARRTSSFCLTFNYRLVGHQVGTLRVLLDNDTNQLWEKRHTRSQEWQTELLTITWENEAPEEVRHFGGTTIQPLHDFRGAMVTKAAAVHILNSRQVLFQINT